MAHIKKRLTPEQFDAIRPHLISYEAKNVAALRRILVDGHMQKDIARELTVSEAAVSAMVGRAWKTHQEHGIRPEGWKNVNVSLPAGMAEVVEEMARVAQARIRE